MSTPNQDPAPSPISEVLADVGRTRPATCPKCSQDYTQTKFPSGWVPNRCEACREALRIAVEEQPVAQVGQLRLAELKVPPLYADVALETFCLHGNATDRAKQARCVQLARRYLADWPDVAPITICCGISGSGKGHVTWSLGKRLAIELGVSGRVVKLSDVIRDLREAWTQNETISEATRLARYREAGFLVIDEVSTHSFYGEPRQHLYDIVDHRLEWLRPTMLTSNERPENLARLLGPALTSRAAGSSGLWDFGEDDYRLWTRHAPAEREESEAA